MGLKEMFRSIDTDNSGTITLEELKQGLAKQGTKLSEYEVKQLLEAVRFLFLFLKIPEASLLIRSLNPSFYFYEKIG